MNSFCQSRSSPPGWFAVRGGDASSDVAFVTDGVVIAEEFAQAGLVDCLGVVGVAGQWVGDVHQVAGQIADELVGVAGGLVLAGVQFGCRSRTSTDIVIVDRADSALDLLGQLGDELVECLGDDLLRSLIALEIVD